MKNRSGKSEANAGVADASRGSSAITGFVRSSYTLQPMDQQTAVKIGLPAERALQMVRLDDAKRNYARRSARERWFEIVSVLPNGERVLPTEFESAAPEVVRRAHASVGVHVQFDFNRQRMLHEMQNVDDKERQTMALRTFLVADMDDDAVDRATLIRSIMASMDLKETAARARIDNAVPADRKNSVKVEVDGWNFDFWREPRTVGGTTKWMICRERGHQVFEPTDNLSIEEGIFG